MHPLPYCRVPSSLPLPRAYAFRQPDAAAAVPSPFVLPPNCPWFSSPSPPIPCSFHCLACWPRHDPIIATHAFGQRCAAVLHLSCLAAMSATHVMLSSCGLCGRARVGSSHEERVGRSEKWRRSGKRGSKGLQESAGRETWLVQGRVLLPQHRRRAHARTGARGSPMPPAAPPRFIWEASCVARSAALPSARSICSFKGVGFK